MKNLIVLSAFAFLLPFSVQAHCAAHADAVVQVTDPWVRATVPQQRATGAFMVLKAQQAARVVAAESEVAGLVEIHEMTMDGKVMKMRAVGALELPAGESVELKPGGFHVMLLDLKAQVREGDVVPITLTIELADGTREDVQVSAPARPLTQQHTSGHGHHRH